METGAFSDTVFPAFAWAVLQTKDVVYKVLGFGKQL